jgi:serine/threonine protein kinase
MSLRGSIYWMAPEVVKNEPYSAKVDIWSLGCTVIEMLTGQRPWLSLNQIAALYNVRHTITLYMMLLTIILAWKIKYTYFT